MLPSCSTTRQTLFYFALREEIILCQTLMTELLSSSEYLFAAEFDSWEPESKPYAANIGALGKVKASLANAFFWRAGTVRFVSIMSADGRPQIARPQPCLRRLKARPGTGVPPAAAQPRTRPANRLAAEPSTNQPLSPTGAATPGYRLDALSLAVGWGGGGVRRRHAPLSGGSQSKGHCLLNSK